jgi:hypothetical protein
MRMSATLSENNYNVKNNNSQCAANIIAQLHSIPFKNVFNKDLEASLKTNRFQNDFKL